MKISKICTAVIAGLVLAGCSGGDDQSKEMAKAAEKAAEQALPEESQTSLTEALERVGDALGGEGEQAVAAGDLKSLLPDELAGLKRVSYEAERAGFGVKVAKARAQYGNEKKMLSLMITDLGAVSGLAKMGMEMFDSEIDKEDEKGFERTTTYKGHRSYQRLIKSGDQSLGEVMVFVDGRFTVHLDGQNVEWTDIQKALDSLDLAALQKLNPATGG